jgi:hypothetical protein
MGQLIQVTNYKMDNHVSISGESRNICDATARLAVGPAQPPYWCLFAGPSGRAV